MKFRYLIPLSLLFLSVLAFSAEPTKNFQLVNQDGKPFQLYDLKGKYVFLSFVFTRCPHAKMCPLTVTLSKQVREKWNKALPEKPLHLLFVTLDPEYDTAKVLKKFAGARSLPPKDTTLATGNPQTLADLAGEFNVIALPGGALWSHNIKSILLAPNLSIIEQYRENEWKPEAVVSDGKKYRVTVPSS